MISSVYLHMTHELIRSSLVQACYGKLHLVRNVDLQGMVMYGVLICVVFWDVGDGWCSPS